MSKFYIISGAVINGKPVNFKHNFSSRDNAINAYFHRYEKELFSLKNLQVENEITHSKHDITYVCSPAGNRFEVSRVLCD